MEKIVFKLLYYANYLRNIQIALSSYNSVHDYTYENSNWKEKLLCCDGKVINYDAIGYIIVLVIFINIKKTDIGDELKYLAAKIIKY